VTGGRGGGAGGGDQFRQGDTRALGDRFAAREALERERYNAARDLDGEWIAQQKDFAAQSNEIRHQWMLRQVAIDSERGAALRDQEDLNLQIERKAHMERLGLASQYASLLGNAGQQIAGVAGANAAALHLIEATSEGVQLAIAVAKAANPLGGQAFYPEVAAHALALATALAAAANPSKPSSGRGGGSGSGGGGGGGQGVTGFAPSAGSGGAGGAPQTIVINIPGVYTTQRSLEAALVGALGSAADNGYRIPGRAVEERRR
jgi:hypothetical protein